RLFLKKTIAAIKKVKARLDAQYQVVHELSLKESLTPKEKAKIKKLKKLYKAKGFPCLLRRLRTHPVSVVIAQATLESGWGSSRFYREANNIFGVWSFNPHEPRMAAGTPREGQDTIYVKKYPNLEASIESYYRMIARGRAFKQFRIARLHTDNPFEIIAYLNHYSELRHEYVKRLYYVIKSNKFYQLDATVYQPPGWHKIKPAKAEFPIPEPEEPAAKVADNCNKKNKKIIVDITTDKEGESSLEANTTAISQEGPAAKVADNCNKKAKKIIVDIAPDKEAESSLEANTTAISQDSNSSVRKIDSNRSKKSEVVTENAEEMNSSV
ncbi:MAG: glucosaminidase domain-containing protein, partial [Thiovulaceae bacterium]|nr:glucosaminidase domain-containing protein [Sulfurimonadaceae bacterium]